MSFSDRPSYGDWRHVLGCLLFGVLFIANVLFLLTWYLSFWDLSTDTYRSLTILDFILVPGVPLASLAITFAYVRWATRDRN